MRTLAQGRAKKESSVDVMKCLMKESLEKDGLLLRDDVRIPEPNFDEVRIRVLATAVCGTDKSIYLSSRSEGIRLEMQRYISDKERYSPIIVGHEFCGIVDALGRGLAELGDDVSIWPFAVVRGDVAERAVVMAQLAQRRVFAIGGREEDVRVEEEPVHP